jgi:hypothetical protein
MDLVTRSVGPFAMHATRRHGPREPIRTARPGRCSGLSVLPAAQGACTRSAPRAALPARREQRLEAESPPEGPAERQPQWLRGALERRAPRPVEPSLSRAAAEVWRTPSRFRPASTLPPTPGRASADLPTSPRRQRWPERPPSPPRRSIAASSKVARRQPTTRHRATEHGPLPEARWGCAGVGGRHQAVGATATHGSTAEPRAKALGGTSASRLEEVAAALGTLLPGRGCAR